MKVNKDLDLFNFGVQKYEVVRSEEIVGRNIII